MSLFSKLFIHKRRHSVFGRHKSKLSKILKEIIKRKEKPIEIPPPPPLPPPLPPIEIPTEDLVDMSSGIIELDVVFTT